MQWQAVPGIRTGKPETLLARPRSGVFRYNATSWLVDLHPAILPFDWITDSCVYLICLCLHYSCMSSGLKSCAYWRRVTSTGRRLANYSTSTSTTAPNTWKRFVSSLPPAVLLCVLLFSWWCFSEFTLRLCGLTELMMQHTFSHRTFFWRSVDCCLIHISGADMMKSHFSIQCFVAVTGIMGRHSVLFILTSFLI